MTLVLLAYLGGVLTILSPCILPVLPFVFARSDRPFVRSTLPLLLGMAATFALVATLAAVGGAWAVRANQVGRYAALGVLAIFGLAMVFPRIADRLARPVVAIGSRLSERATADGADGIGRSFLLGIATGMLWAPCAGPILGLVLTGAALQGANVATTLLLLAYAAGAATSLALAAGIGGRVFAWMKRSLGAGERLRRVLGVAILVGVAAIASGMDTGLLTRLSLAGSNRIEGALVALLGPNRSREATGPAAADAGPVDAGALPDEGLAPPLDGAVEWLNGAPLSSAHLRGKVVLVDFWTYSCINCLRSLPYVRAWADTYRDEGLVVVGVHAPEFAFEKDPDNVRRAVADLGITYPVAIDNAYAIWRAFKNEYWPAHYFIDARGHIRHHHFGEGDYAHSEQVIRALLEDAGHAPPPTGAAVTSAVGTAMAPDFANIHSPETYLGYKRAQRFVASGGQVPDASTAYASPGALALNEWSVDGRWTFSEERATLDEAPGTLTYRFDARDLNLVLAPGKDGRAIRYRVRIDGQPPGADHGVDTDAAGDGTVDRERLYQLYRASGASREHRFEIEFLDPGAHAYAFTFG